MASSVACKTCGTNNRAEARFCHKCGTSLWLKDRYTILYEVGQGGFGAVYKAKDTLFGNRLVAVKEMNQSSLNQSEISKATADFKREAQMLAILDHPSLPHIYDYFSDAGSSYLVMDFIEGETLEEYRCKAKGGNLPVEEVFDIGRQLSTVLDYLHTRQPPIIFRDLKPDNIMRTPDGHLYLIDFGIARHFQTGRLYTDNLGTKGYAAPEQFRRQEPATLLSDIYGLGAVLHHLLSGNDPLSNTPTLFHFMPLKSYIPLIPPELDRLVMQMLEVDMNKRPTSMADIKKELEGITFQLTTPPPVVVPQPGISALSVTVSQTAPQIYRSQMTLHVFKGHKREVYSVTWSPDGKYIASGSSDRTVRIWDVLKKDEKDNNPYPRAVKVVAWSLDGRYIASMGTDQTVQVRNVLTGDILPPYTGHVTSGMGIAFALAWSPDSRYLASGCDDEKVFVWSATSGSDVSVYHGHERWISAVAWSPDGKYIASGSSDRTMQVWDALSGTNVLTFDGHTREVCAITWSPDSKDLASAYKDQIKVWDATNKDKPLAIYTHHKGVNTIAWSPDGRYIASGGNDRTVQIWDVSAQKIVYVYLEHLAPVRTVAWSPDGKYIASGDEDKLICLWEIK